jgi:hypothetical protein
MKRTHFMWPIIAIVVIFDKLAWPGAALAQANYQNPYLAASGLYAVTSAVHPVVPNPFPSNVRGIVARFRWKDIETSDGIYSWTALNNVFSTIPASKIIALDILTGTSTPDWALNKYETDGTGTFTSMWSNDPSSYIQYQNTNNLPNHPLVNCGAFEIPIPWDTTYQTDLGNFLSALAAHIATLPDKAALVRIEANAFTDNTGDELFLMNRTVQTPITCDTTTPYTNNSFCPYAGGNPLQSCNPVLDTAAWQAVGYTPQRVEQAWIKMLGFWANDFPGIVISMTQTTGSMPPIDNNGNATGQPEDYSIKYLLQRDALQTVPYLAVQNNTGQYPYPSSNIQQGAVSRTMIGTQEKAGGVSDFDQFASFLVQNDYSYLELYPSDVSKTTFDSIRAFMNASMANPLHGVGG